MTKGPFLFSPARSLPGVAVHPGQPVCEPSRFQFQNLLDYNESPDAAAVPLGGDDGLDTDDKDYCILSQDFFCTPDYITPEEQKMPFIFEEDKENMACPESPQKSTSVRSKRQREEGYLTELDCNHISFERQMFESTEAAASETFKHLSKATTSPISQQRNYVSQSAIALRCRVMPPPCISNPFTNGNACINLDTFINRKMKALGLSNPMVHGDGVSRYHTDFHEIEQIGSGNFSRVYKVLNRVDGCIYAMKHIVRSLHQDTDRRRALMEVQALAAIGHHENVVGYHSSWFENDRLYIQMELCDHSLSMDRSQLRSEKDIVDVIYQIAKALRFIHGRGIAHLDVKPENIYVKNDKYKLGDFGFATLLNRSLPIEEGDARYMPLEVLNDCYEHLDKADIFSLGAVGYELLKGSPLPCSGPQFLLLREGKTTLLPGYSIHFQNLLKEMMHPDPHKRPSASELVGSSLFDKVRRTF